MALLATLPIERLAWPEFESLCLDFVQSRPEVRTASKYGRPGDDQRGIDILSVHHDGSRSTYQCRRVQAFGPADVRELVAETTVVADAHYIVTACEVSSKTHDACPQGWSIITGSTLATQIRLLPRALARKLVEAYFDRSLVRTFLGLNEYPVFIPVKDYFRNFEDPTLLVSHIGGFHGRLDELKRTQAFLDSDAKFMLVYGPPGLGKSRLVKEALSNIAEPCFVVGDRLIDELDTSELPAEAVLFLDDAHQSSNVNAVIEIARARPEVKVVMSSRAHSPQSIRLRIQAAGSAPEAIDELEILPLTHEAAVQLAMNFVDDASEAERLARLSGRVPLIIVTAGRIAQTKGTNWGDIFTQEFKRFIFSVFEADITKDALEVGLQPYGIKLLQLLAALTPAPNQDYLYERIAVHLNIRVSEVRTIIGAYTRIGIIRITRSGLRLQPDALADHILEQALYPSDILSGFHKEVVQSFPELLPEIAASVSQIDWLRQRAGKPTGALSDLFRQFEDSLKYSASKDQLYKRLGDIGYYQPDLIIDFVKRVSLGEQSSEVLAALAKLVAPAGYNAELTSDVFRLLWEMATAGSAEAKSELAEILSPRRHKPVWFVVSAIDLLTERLERDRGLNAGVVTDLVGVALAKTARHAYSMGRKMFFEGLKTSYAALKVARTALIRRLILLFEQGTRELKLAALHGLLTALRDPVGEVAIEVDDQYRLQWAPEQLSILDILQTIVGSETDLRIKRDIYSAVEWHQRYSRSEEVKRHAKPIMDILQSDRRLLIFLVLMNDRLLIDLDNPRINVATGIPLHKFEQATDAFSVEFPDASSGLAFLQTCYQAAEGLQRFANELLFIHLADRNPEYTILLIERAVATRLDKVLLESGQALRVLRNKGMAGELCARLAVSDYMVDRAVYATSFIGLSWADSFDDQTFATIETLLHDQPIVAISAARALWGVPDQYRMRAMRLLGSMFKQEHTALAKTAADMVAVTLYEHEVDTDTALALIAAVGQLDSLDGYGYSHILNRLMPEFGIQVIEMLIGRVARAWRGLPLPDILDFKPLSENSELWKRALRLIRDTENSLNNHEQSELFVEAGLHLKTSIPFELLSELDYQNPTDVVKVSFLLSQAPPEILFDNVDFVDRLLESADACGVMGKVTANLFGVFYRFTVHSVPSEDDIMVRDRSLEVLSTRSLSSVCRQFYSRLHKRAIQEIDKDLERTLDLDD